MTKVLHTKLKKAVLATLAVILMLSGLYGTVMDYKTAFGLATQLDSRYEYYLTTTGQGGVYGVNWSAQTFTPEEAHTISGVRLKLDSTGSPGTVDVGITATSGGEPTGADLCSGTLSGAVVVSDGWYYVDLGAGYSLTASTMYAIVVSLPTGDVSNNIKWDYDNSSPTYSGGTTVWSSDSGSTWSVQSGYDSAFQEWGPGAYYSGPASAIKEADTEYPVIATLDATTAVSGYVGADGYMYCEVGTIHNSYITWSGDSYIVDGTHTVAASNGISVIPLTSTTFVAALSSGGGTVVYSYVGTLAGTVIAYGSNTSPTSMFQCFGGENLTSSTFVMAGRGFGTAMFVIGSVTGTTISYGTAVTKSNNASAPSVDVLSSALVATSWRYWSSPNSIVYTGIYSVSGTTLTELDTDTVFSGTSNTGPSELTALSSASYAVVYYDTATSSHKAKIATVTGGATVALGSGYEMGFSAPYSADSFSSTELVIVGAEYIDSLYYAVAIVGEVTGSSIEFNNAFRWYDVDYAVKELNVNAARVVDSTTLAIAFVDDTDSDYTKSVMVRTQTFETDEPDVTTNVATSITDNTARLNGTLNYDGGESCEYRFGLGTATGDYWYTGWSSGAALNTSDTFYYDASGLDSGTTYYFIAEASNGHFVDTGSELSFTTTGLPPGIGEPPAVTTKAATNIADTYALLNGALDQLGDYGTVYCRFEYDVVSHAVDGENYAYYTAEQTMTGVGDLTGNISSLYPGTTWYFRISCRYNTYSYVHGLEKSFNTLPDTSAGAGPRVLTWPATQITTTSAVLNGALISMGNQSIVYTAFQYDTSGSYTEGSTYTTAWNTFTTEQSYYAQITDLEPYTTYHFRAMAFYGAGNGSYTYGESLTFDAGTIYTTMPNPSTPLVFNAANVYINCLETGDVGVIVDYTIDYGDSDNVLALPEVATDAFFVAFTNTDGVTQLRSTSPFDYLSNGLRGYGRNVSWFYFPASEVTAYSLDSAYKNQYRVVLMGNPTVPSGWADTPPKVTYGIDTWQTEGSTDVLMSLGVLQTARELESAWDLSLTQHTPMGTKLGTYGEAYFEVVVPNLRRMAPSAFASASVNPTDMGLDYDTYFGAVMTNGTGVVNGSPIVLSAGNNTVTVTTAGTFLLDLDPGTVGNFSNITGIATGSPVDLVAGNNTVTVTTIGTFDVYVELQNTWSKAKEKVSGTKFDMSDLADKFGVPAVWFSGIVWLFMSILVCAAVYKVSEEHGQFAGMGAGKMALLIFDVCIIGGALMGLISPLIAVLLFLGYSLFIGYVLFFRGSSV